MNKAVWGVITGVLTILTVFIFWSINSGTDLSSLRASIDEQRANSRQTQVPYQSSVIDTGTQNVGPPLTEIQITADDVLNADAKGLIGAGYPFNNTYITRDEIIAEVKEINPRFDGLTEEYKNYVITLRHLEKVENVSIENSKVGEIINTYLGGASVTTVLQ